MTVSGKRIAEEQTHNIEPVFDGRARFLILGSFPSRRSREEGFFYGHPQNRFWRVMAAVLGTEVPRSIDEKRKMLLGGGIALWDVIASCRIEGASDASIRDVVPQDLSRILRAAPIERVFTNGGTAHRLYVRYQQALTGLEDTPLPSTSPANARMSPDELTDIWRRAFLEK